MKNGMKKELINIRLRLFDEFGFINFKEGEVGNEQKPQA